MIYKKIIVVFLLAASLFGCALTNKRAIDTATVPKLKDKVVTYVVRPMPGFYSMTPNNSSAGLLAYPLAHSEGLRIVKENKVENPSGAVALRLATEISKQFGMKLLSEPIQIYDDYMDDADISKMTKKSADFVIDVSTYMWRSEQIPLDFAHYRITYTASARVIDTATESVVAKGYCSHITDENSNAPSYQELFGYQATRFKNEMAILATNCANSMLADMHQNNDK